MNRYIILILAAVVMSSCYKRGTLDAKEFETASFSAWMQKNAPQAVKMEEGIYYEILAKNPDGAKMVPEKSWFMMNYEGKTLDNLIFSSRSEDISRQMGKFQYYNHYVPLFTIFSESASKYTTGQYKGLALMNEGDSIRMYLSTTYGNPTNYHDFSEFIFNNNMANISISPVIYDMRLVKIINEPKKYEDSLVVDYADKKLKLAVKDSIAYGYYMLKLHSNPKGDTIGKDSAVLVNYVGRYLDGFVFDTNIDSVARKHQILVASDSESDTKKYTPLWCKESKGDLINGWSVAFRHMRRGEKAVVVFVSQYGYGVSGKSNASSYSATNELTASATDIQPYTPLVFEIEILNKRPED